MSANRSIPRVDVFQIATPTVEGFHEALLPSQAHLSVHIGLDARIGLEIQAYQVCCFRSAEVGLLAEAKGGHAVNDAKIHCFRMGALVRST